MSFSIFYPLVFVGKSGNLFHDKILVYKIQNEIKLIKSMVDYSIGESIVLRRIFSGVVTVEQVIFSWKHVIDNDLLKPTHKGIISDYRGACYTIKDEDVDTLESFFNENADSFKGCKLAMVLDSVESGEEIISKKNLFLDRKAFSSIQKALEWVQGS